MNAALKWRSATRKQSWQKNAEAKWLLQDAAKEWRTMAAFADRHVAWDNRRFSPLKDE